MYRLDLPFFPPTLPLVYNPPRSAISVCVSLCFSRVSKQEPHAIGAFVRLTHCGPGGASIRGFPYPLWRALNAIVVERIWQLESQLANQSKVSDTTGLPALGSTPKFLYDKHIHTHTKIAAPPFRRAQVQLNGGTPTVPGNTSFGRRRPLRAWTGRLDQWDGKDPVAPSHCRCHSSSGSGQEALVRLPVGRVRGERKTRMEPVPVDWAGLGLGQASEVVDGTIVSSRDEHCMVPDTARQRVVGGWGLVL